MRVRGGYSLPGLGFTTPKAPHISFTPLTPSPHSPLSTLPSLSPLPSVEVWCFRGGCSHLPTLPSSSSSILSPYISSFLPSYFPFLSLFSSNTSFPFFPVLLLIIISSSLSLIPSSHFLSFPLIFSFFPSL